MPRGKSHRRSEAACRRVEATWAQRVRMPEPSSDFVPRCGTGWRHKVKEWPMSEVTLHRHKLVIPAGSTGEKFILLIGASHLRSIADGIVPMPGNRIAFGVMSTPGACADDLHREVLHAVVPREPDAVCVMAPSNNLMASKTPEQAGQAFERYLLAVFSRWPKVFCTAMVPRLTESEDKMRAFQQEFHRCSNRLGVTYHPIDDYFPRTHPHMWSRDGIHLSDEDGMPLLAELMWIAAYQFLETPEPKPLVQSQVSRPYKPRFVPRVVVKGVERAPPPPPSEWTLVKFGRKRNHSGESESTSEKSGSS
ncbi:uncharacterized protein LOC124884006 [Girardinichthys multiradiatus]|uniref:uncharacterized protein LOC124884006 n=1 Tax=Girardinichthys multiradiatus TaxID=208333 RepID=UPI001FAD79CA|nr:uncharacterized protein LOC124884006 [Girardinichthys multiradiatus]